MSENPDRIPLLKAQEIAIQLRKLWSMGDRTCLTVGSVRRLEKTVGDLEFTAPLPIDGQDDSLFEIMQETISRQGGLWADDKRSISGRAVAGFATGFKFCNLLLEIPDEMIGGTAPALFPIKVQIHRYTPSCTIAGAPQKSNRGWIEVMRTGPKEFNQMFLLRWRSWFHIPEGRDGSLEGFLRDRDGNPIDTPTEASCFSMLNNWRFIPPEERAELAESSRRRRTA